VLAWDDAVERAFFAARARAAAARVHVPPSIADSGRAFRELKAAVPGDNARRAFLRDTCDAFATAARMLAAVGTRDFYIHAVELYGRPASLTADRKTTNLDLASTSRRSSTASRGAADPEPARRAGLHGRGGGAACSRALRALLPGLDIGVELVDDIASKAAAGVDGVRIKRGGGSRGATSRSSSSRRHVHVATR
jgi:hypothetical protein